MTSPETPFAAENAFTKPLIQKLSKHPKRIVFPEPDDDRILRVAAEMARREVSVPFLIGNRDYLRKRAKDIGVDLGQFVGIIDPANSTDLDLFCDRFENMERFRKVKVSDPRELITKPHYYAAMMVQYGHADGIVGGNNSFPATLFRALFAMIKPSDRFKRVASCDVMVNPKHPYFGIEGILFLADCAVIPDPEMEEIAAIGVETGRLANQLLDREIEIAMLSFSTKGSARTPTTEKMAAAAVQARKLIKEARLDMQVDGELQLDAALVPESAENKGAAASVVAGKADVLVFPNLNSGNISYHVMQHIAGAQPYGHLLLGLSKPAAQVSRVASEETIFGTALAVGVQAITYRELYPVD